MGSSSTNYPAPVLAGLFGGNNQSFAMAPQSANAAFTPANTAAQSGITNLGQQPFGYNPWITAGEGGQLGQAGAQAIPYGPATFNALAAQAPRLIDSGQQTYSALAQQAPGAMAAGEQTFNTLAPQANTDFSTGINNFNNLAQWGNQAVGAGQQAAAPLMSYVQQALQQGFDPQQALYNKLFQQQQDQGRAANAASGVATTPYGAALSQQGNQNFDIAWQQAQLANQAQGASTASGLTGAGMGALAQGYGAANNLIGTGLSGLQGLQNTAGGLYGIGSGALNQALGTEASLYGTGMGALAQGVGTAGNLYGTGMGAIEGGLGAAGGAETAGANLAAQPMNLQNANYSQQLNNLLNYITTSNQGAAGLSGANTAAFGATNNLYGNQITQQLGQNQQLGQSLGGLGSLLGTLGGGALNYAGLNNIASGLA